MQVLQQNNAKSVQGKRNFKEVKVEALNGKCRQDDDRS
jgi:hypothetical protein